MTHMSQPRNYLKQTGINVPNSRNYAENRKNIHLIIHFPTSEGVNEVSKRANKWAQWCKAEQPREWAAQANERTGERVAQYSSLDSRLFWLAVLTSGLADFLVNSLRQHKKKPSPNSFLPYRTCIDDPPLYRLFFLSDERETSIAGQNRCIGFILTHCIVSMYHWLVQLNPAIADFKGLSKLCFIPRFSLLPT